MGAEFQSPAEHIKNLLKHDHFDELKTYIQESNHTLEPYCLEALPDLLNKLTHIRTEDSARDVGILMIKKMNPFAMKIYMDAVYEHFTSMKWQIKKGALILLGYFAFHQKEVVKFNLPNMILKLIDMSSDIKTDVKIQTRQCFGELCMVIDNVDIKGIIADVINAYMEPVKYTESALDSLVATSFINEVDMSTLGLLVPILKKGMYEKKVAVKRRAALVIGNMCKLVNDPRTAAYFYPILKPVLERGIDEIAIEEVRKVCQNSLNTLQRVSSEAAEISDNVMKQKDIYDCIKKHSSDLEIEDIILTHISKC